MPGTYNPSFVAGDTVQFDVELKNPSGTPKSLVGYTAKAQIRETVTSPDVLAEFNVIGALDETGIIRLRLEAEQSAVFRTTPNGVWDLEIVKTSDGTKLTVVSGQILTTPDVTR